MRGTATDAEAQRLRLVAGHRDHPQYVECAGNAVLPPPSRVTVGALLEVWIAADHPWKPSTLTGYRSNARALAADPIAACRAEALSPQHVRHRLRAWEDAGAGLAVRGGRFRVLRACLSWAYNERLIDTHPLRLMRGPGRCDPRRPLAQDEIHALLIAAELRLLEAHANHDAPVGATRGHRRLASGRVHRAEQDLLLVRLAADTGARRGELTALRFTDLSGPTGRTLHIERAVSAGQLTTPKAGHGRNVMGHRFEQIRDAAGVPDATLHRLRHSVATYLVANGQILQAQARLGHADAATTLREYSHALPATDTFTADAINDHLDLARIIEEQPAPDTDHPTHY